MSVPLLFLYSASNGLVYIIIRNVLYTYSQWKSIHVAEFQDNEVPT